LRSAAMEGEEWRKGKARRQELADMEWGECVGSPLCLGKDMVPFFFLPPLLCSGSTSCYCSGVLAQKLEARSKNVSCIISIC
jgi:hypothetical protein